MHYVDKYQSPLGGMTMASDGDALAGLWFDNQKYFAGALSGEGEERALPVFMQTKEWLDIYFNGRIPEFVPRMAFDASAFRVTVWNILRKIPYGQTITYKEIADKIARQRGLAHMSAQAVGGAVAHNPISIIVPCHRVVGTNGSLTGYAGGIERKKKLLILEKANAPRVI